MFLLFVFCGSSLGVLAPIWGLFSVSGATRGSSRGSLGLSWPLSWVSGCREDVSKVASRRTAQNSIIATSYYTLATSAIPKIAQKRDYKREMSKNVQIAQRAHQESARGSAGEPRWRPREPKKSPNWHQGHPKMSIVAPMWSPNCLKPTVWEVSIHNGRYHPEPRIASQRAPKERRERPREPERARRGARTNARDPPEGV